MGTMHDLPTANGFLLLNEWRAHRHIRESFNAHTGAGCHCTTSDPFYTWGALISLMSVMQAGHVGTRQHEN